MKSAAKWLASTAAFSLGNADYFTTILSREMHNYPGYTAQRPELIVARQLSIIARISSRASVLTPPGRYRIVRLHLRDALTVHRRIRTRVLAYAKGKRDSVFLHARSLRMIRAASSNCHFLRIYGAYTRRRCAKRVDVCNVNGLSAYVLLTSSSGKHARLVRHTEICARLWTPPRCAEGKGRRAPSRSRISAIFLWVHLRKQGYTGEVALGKINWPERRRY